MLFGTLSAQAADPVQGDLGKRLLSCLVPAAQELPPDDFVGHLKDLDTHRVRFDFATMGCPFTVELGMNQPYAPNSAGEVGGTNLNRTAFLAWLRGVSLRTPRETERFLVGATMRVLVPCGALDLTS